MTLDECTPQLRVKVPGGMTGRIVRVSTTLKMAVLVQRDDGAVLAYRPGELTVLEQPRGHTLGPLP